MYKIIENKQPSLPAKFELNWWNGFAEVYSFVFFRVFDSLYLENEEFSDPRIF